MKAQKFYHATDKQGRSTGKLSPTKLIAWLIVPILMALWIVYLVHLGHGHKQVLSVWEIGGLSVGGVAIMAAAYYAERQLAEAAVKALNDRLGDDHDHEHDRGDDHD